jgi:uncharacterized membrane protein (UPF0182 family)
VTRPRGGRLVILVAALLLLLLVASRGLTNLYVEALWFGEVGYAGVFWKQWAWIWGVRGGAAVLVTLALFLNLRRVAGTLGTLQIRRKFGNLEIAERLPAHYVTGTTLGLSALLGLWFGASITEGVARSSLFWSAAPAWGAVDPLLGLDLGFYAFALPVLRAAVTFGLVVAFLVFTVSTAGYATTGVLRMGDGAVVMTDGARKHLGVLVAVFMALLAARLAIGRPLLLLAGTSDVQGIVGYTDVAARLPGFRAQALLTLAGAAGVAMGAWRNRLLPALAGVGLSLLGALLIGQVYPATVQRFQVVPNELAREAPYIQHNLDFTRLGFGLDEMERSRFEARTEGPVDWAEASRQFEGLPVWSRSALLTTFREVEARFRYYDFPGVTIDRYPDESGQLRPVALAVREVDPEGIEDPNWQNLHLRERYVVGNGAVAVDVTGRTPEGRPRTYLAGLPPVMDDAAPPALSLEREDIFFGTRSTQPYALITPTDSAYRALDGGPGVPGVDVPEGIAVGGFLRKSVLAWYLREANVLFASGVGSDSRMILRRGVSERVSRIAPFLWFPEAPFAVIHEGRVVWVLEGMTATRFFPIASPSDLQFGRSRVSYVRNSVKVTVDAVTGDVKFYTVPIDDPLRDAYAAAFPGLLRPLSEMPEGIRRHLRYSQDLLSLQSNVLLDYHQDTPATFFARQDVWANPQELAQGTSPVPYRPEYGLLRLPGDDDSGFRLVTAFVPAGRQNLTALLAGELREDGSPRLRLFDVPVENQVPGPRQIEALVEQDPEISQQFSLWRTGGSRVWTGHLHVVPVGDRMVYMEPVFLAAEEDAIPELRRFVVSDGQRVAMEATLAGAVAALGGTAAAVVLAGDESGGPDVAVDVGSATAWPREAVQLLDAAEERLRAGDWTGFGEALQELRDLLRGAGGGDRSFP